MHSTLLHSFINRHGLYIQTSEQVSRPVYPHRYWETAYVRQSSAMWAPGTNKGVAQPTSRLLILSCRSILTPAVDKKSKMPSQPSSHSP